MKGNANTTVQSPVRCWTGCCLEWAAWGLGQKGHSSRPLLLPSLLFFSLGLVGLCETSQWAWRPLPASSASVCCHVHALGWQNLRGRLGGEGPKYRVRGEAPSFS